MPAKAARSGARRSTSSSPAIAQLRAEGIDAIGPFAADTHVPRRARARAMTWRCACYHDQALIPLKTLHFDEGVNITLGLPIVRTSPDHGTAFDIAGQDQAQPGRDDRRDPHGRPTRRSAAPLAADRVTRDRAAAASRGHRAARPAARARRWARTSCSTSSCSTRIARGAGRSGGRGGVRGRPRPRRPDPRAARAGRQGDRGRARPPLPPGAGRAGRGVSRASCA